MDSTIKALGTRAGPLAPYVIGLATLISVAVLRAEGGESISSVRMLAITLASALLIWLPGLALVCLARRRLNDIEACIVFVLGCGASGFALFVLWFVSPILGAVAGALILLGSTVIVCERPQAGLSLARPLLLMTIAVVFYIAVGLDRGGAETALHTIAIRYWPSVDSALPMLLIDNLMKGRGHLMPFVDAGTHTSDRPPLQAGMMLIGYPLALPPLKIAVALGLGVAANALWIAGLWAFLRALDVSQRATGFVALIVMLTGTVFFNTVYTWPKMLAACYCLCVAALVVRDGIHLQGRPLLVGAFVGLATLAHSGIAFGMIGLAPLLWMFRTKWDWRGMAVAGVVAAVVFAPWVAYQRFVDPPGDRMAKWHLAGVIEPHEDLGVMEAITTQYREAGVAGTLANKALNAKVFVGIHRLDLIPEWAWTDTLLGAIRDATGRAFLLSALLTPFGLVLFAHSPFRRAIGVSVAVVVASSVAFVLLEFGDAGGQSAAWLHHGPYSLLVLWAALGALAVAHAPRWARVMFVLQALVFVGLWIIDTRHTQWRFVALGALRPMMVATQMVALLGMTWLALQWTRKEVPTIATSPSPPAT